MELAHNHALILPDPAPTIRMSAQSSSSIDLTGKFRCNNGDYWMVKFDMLENGKKSLDEQGISILFNQLDVHVKND